MKNHIFLILTLALFFIPLQSTPPETLNVTQQTSFFDTIYSYIQDGLEYCTQTINNATAEDTTQIRQNLAELENSRYKTLQDINQIIHQIDNAYEGNLKNQKLFQEFLEPVVEEWFKKANTENIEPLNYTQALEQVLSRIQQKINREHPTYEQYQNELATIQQKLGSCKPSRFAAVCKWIGYAAVFSLGPYAGNWTYQKFFEHYFDSSGATQDEILQQIMHLEEQCSVMQEHYQQAQLKANELPPAQRTNIEQLLTKLETSIKKAQTRIAHLNQQILDPPKPSKLKQIGGIALRIGLIVSTTYVLYLLHQKTFESWRNQPLTPQELENKAILEQRKTEIMAFNKIYNYNANGLSLLNRIKNRLEPDSPEPAQADYFVKNIFMSYENLISLRDRIKEIKEEYENIQVRNKTKWLSILLDYSSQ